MNILSLRYFTVSILLLVLLPTGRAVHGGEDPQKEGGLVVKVTWGDIDNTLASGVYVEAYGFVEKYDAKKSFVLMQIAQHYRIEGLLTQAIEAARAYISKSSARPLL